MNGLSLALLGAVSVTYDGQILERFRTSRVRALLYFLATEQVLGTLTHRREALMELLWPGLPLQSAQVNFRQTIYHLRQAIPEKPDEASGDDLPFLLSDRQTVRINPLYSIDSDVADFIRFLEGSIEERIEATELYRGDFLADFYLVDSSAYESWIAKRRAAFRRQALDTLTDLAAFHSDQGNYKEAEGFARQQVEIDDLRESAYRQLMKVLALSGRRSEALTEYEKCRQTLLRELGIKPSVETLDLLEKIRTQHLITDLSKRLPADYAVPIVLEEVGDDIESEASRPMLDTLLPQDLERYPRCNLPPQPGRFIGREVELADLDAFIADPEVRLINIFGAGGIGKTRLALAMGEHQYQRALAISPNNGGGMPLSPPSPIINGDAKQEPTFVDGVFFVSLASLSLADQIVPTVAKAIGFRLETGARQSRSRRRQLLDYLNKKRLLIVMDNFEHLSDGAELLSEVVISAPDVQLLVTSRERLHLHHEQVYPIHGLGFLLGDTGIPTEASDVLESPAARLFLQSARRIQPDFEPAVGDIESLMSICSQVEGMPLALELAASWVDVLSLQEIAVEIQRSLDFLETGERDMPRRQRSMSALFESAWDRLRGSERQVFARLSIFRGGFTRQAAKTTTGASIRLLATLVDKSFLHYDSQRGRYQIHELLRQFGAEKLAQNPSELKQVRDQHCAYFCEWLRNKEHSLTGVGQQTVLTEIEVDGENVRLAWHRTVSNKDLMKLYKTMDSLALFYKMSGHYQEAEQATDKAAEALRSIMMDSVETDLLFKSSAESPALVPKFLSRVLTWKAFFLSFFGRFTDADLSLRESLALLESPELTGHDVRLERAFALEINSQICNDLQLEAKLLRESLSLCREVGEQRQTARVLNLLGENARLRADWDEADQILKECLDIQTTLGDSVGIARALLALGWDARNQGKTRESERLVRKGCGILTEVGGWVNNRQVLMAYGVSHLYLGEYADALTSLQSCVDILDYQVDKPFLAHATTMLGLCQTHLGLYGEAYETGKRSFAIYKELGVWLEFERAYMNLSWMALGVESYAEAESLARKASAVYQAKGHQERGAISLSLLGFALLKLGKVGESRKRALQAVRIAVKYRTILPLLLGLTLVALLLLEEEDVERPLEFYALALKEPKVANSKWWHDAVGKHVDAAAAALPPEIVESARSRGRSLDFWQTGAELLDELLARGWERPTSISQG